VACVSGPVIIIVLCELTWLPIGQYTSNQKHRVSRSQGLKTLCGIQRANTLKIGRHCLNSSWHTCSSPQGF
jgi:hypothetical protein